MIRICLIGYGNIAKKHIEVIRSLGGEIVASCNRSEASNMAARTEAGIPVTYTDYLEMIAKEKPDAIINCVTHNAIFSTTKNLIPLGIPILVEKPAGTTVAELKELIALQEEYKTPVQVALNRRHYSVFNKAIESIGGSQNLDMVSVEWSERPLKVKVDKGYTDKMVEEILVGNSIHGIDLLSYFVGGIEEFNSFATSKEGYFNWNMAFSGVSKTGVLANFTSSWSAPVPWRVIFYSKGKRFEFAPLETCKVFCENPADNTTIEPEDYDKQYKAGFYNQAQEFIQLIQNKGNNTHSLQSTLSSMQIAETLLSKLLAAGLATS